MRSKKEVFTVLCRFCYLVHGFLACFKKAVASSLIRPPPKFRAILVLLLATYRIIRRQEVLAWHGDSVKGIRKKINNRAYIFLVTYTLVVLYINLCYVITYDAPTIWYVERMGQPFHV